MKKQTGRKAMVVVSDGVDRGSKESLVSALESAQRANTIVYSILIKSAEANGEGGGHRRGGFGVPGMGGPGMGGPMGRRGGRYPQPQENRPDGKKILEQIPTPTGGRMFEVSKKHPSIRSTRRSSRKSAASTPWASRPLAPTKPPSVTTRFK